MARDTLPTTPWIALDGRIVVQRDEKADKTDGGILLAEKAQVTPKTGVVLHVAPGRMLECGVREDTDLVRGDRVTFPSHAGYSLADDENLIFMRFEDVLARAPRPGELKVPSPRKAKAKK